MARKRKHTQLQGLFLMFLSFLMFCITLYLLIQPKVKDDSFVLEESSAAVRLTRENFFSQIKSTVQVKSKQNNLFTSVVMAQAALESDFGQSQLSSQYNNLFGIKGTKENGVLLLTIEYENGVPSSVKEYFKVYSDWKDSIDDYVGLIVNGTTWNKQQYKAVLNARNYKEAAKALVASGYATDPNYAEKIIDVITKYKLYQYD